jgi:proline iminopeptidase
VEPPTEPQRFISTVAPVAGAPPAHAAISIPAPTVLCCSISAGARAADPPAGDEDADLSTNTTAHLIGDIERLREHLGIDRWVVVAAPGASPSDWPTPSAILTA